MLREGGAIGRRKTPVFGQSTAPDEEIRRRTGVAKVITARFLIPSPSPNGRGGSFTARAATVVLSLRPKSRPSDEGRSFGGGGQGAWTRSGGEEALREPILEREKRALNHVPG